MRGGDEKENALHKHYTKCEKIEESAGEVGENKVWVRVCVCVKCRRIAKRLMRVGHDHYSLIGQDF